MKIIKITGIFLLITSLLLVFGCSSSKSFDSVKESNVTNSYEYSDYEYDDYDAGAAEKTAAGSSEDTANYISDTAFRREYKK